MAFAKTPRLLKSTSIVVDSTSMVAVASLASRQRHRWAPILPDRVAVTGQVSSGPSCSRYASGTTNRSSRKQIAVYGEVVGASRPSASRSTSSPPPDFTSSILSSRSKCGTTVATSDAVCPSMSSDSSVSDVRAITSDAPRLSLSALAPSSTSMARVLSRLWWRSSFRKMDARVWLTWKVSIAYSSLSRDNVPSWSEGETANKSPKCSAHASARSAATSESA
mmetsp:Transcript_21615/g.45137  ORF Transcript_21615/g.45137 Transcript_21615/m.45137 type:complete len:222 (+) Transcript_21615:801-1466(+)